MQSQLAGVYKIGELYLLHAMEQAPPGFWGGSAPRAELTRTLP